MRRAEAPALSRLGATLERHFGLLSRGAEDRAVATALETVAARYGLHADAVAEKAEQSVPLLREVAGQLGVGEAFFFRHAEVLDAATRFIARRAEQQAQVRVWSAGCCRGEEPYSLAIALREHLGPGWASRVALAGCDVSADSLETARLGEYTEWSFRGAVSDARRAAAFEPASQGRWRLKDELRVVRFEHLAVQELVARLAPGEVDAFLFRNVAVYFAPATVKPLFDAMAVALTAGGMLCLAPTDPQPDTPLLSRDPVHPSIYWKGAPPTRKHGAGGSGLSAADAARGSFGGVTRAGAAPGVYGGGPPADAASSFGVSPADAVHTVSFGATPVDAARGVSFGGTPADTARSVSFGGATPSDVARGVSFDATPADAARGVSFGATPADAARGVSFGATPAETTRGVSFGATPADAARGVSFVGTTPAKTTHSVSFGGTIPADAHAVSRLAAQLRPMRRAASRSARLRPRQRTVSRLAAQLRPMRHAVSLLEVDLRPIPHAASRLARLRAARRSASRLRATATS